MTKTKCLYIIQPGKYLGSFYSPCFIVSQIKDLRTDIKERHWKTSANNLLAVQGWRNGLGPAGSHGYVSWYSGRPIHSLYRTSL